jgi:hypothetical protein
MKYNNQSLLDYCSDNNIKLLSEIKDKFINRETYIEGKCITNNCYNNFYKNFRQLVKTGAYCELCIKEISSNKIRDSKVKYDNNILTEFCNENNIILTDDYSNKFINRDTIIEGICLHSACKNIFIKPFRQLLKINGYCENCSKENGKIKIIETNLKKFGVENAMMNNEIKEKQKNTMIQKYGVEHNSQLDKIKKQKKEKSLQKYGVEYVLQSPQIRQQIKDTNLEKYGAENPQQNIDISNKRCSTNLIKYGSKSPTGNIKVQEKIIKTNLEKYGVQHHSQNAEVADKMLKNSYNKKQYILPSGKIIDYQGYENFALIELLFIEKISEYEIITSRKLVPEIWYNDKNGKRRRHYVDFYIKSQNRCIEVKSTWTNQDKNSVFEKQKSAKDLGFIYDIWIFDKNGDKLETY